MSLYNAKCRAIRQTLICDCSNFEKLEKYLQEQKIEDMPYSQLAEHFIKNGDCGLDVDLEFPLRDAFATYVNEHTTLPLREIEDIIAEWCGEDFLMDSWDDIVDAHFGGVEFYDNVVYVVESEWDGRKWERTCETNLFSTYEKAKAFFDKAKGNAILDMDELSDSWTTDIDDESCWVGQDYDYESYIEINFYKKAVQ